MSIYSLYVYIVFLLETGGGCEANLEDMKSNYSFFQLTKSW